MRHPARTRLVVSIALIIFGIAVTFAAADSLINTRDADKSPSPSSSAAQIAGASGAEPDATADVLGAQESSAEPRADEDRAERKRCDEDRRCEGAWGDAARSGAAMAAAFVVPEDDQPQADKPAVDHIRQLIPTVRERVDDLLKIRQCISSIGGEAVCFEFGDGSYLVGDGLRDGAGELGFCSSDGYYFISGPTPDGGAAVECPDGSGGDETAAGHAPKTRECTSSIGGDATCFAFGGGKYLVSDPVADGEGELGFCNGDSYYVVTGPSAAGGTRGDCPDAATER